MHPAKPIDTLKRHALTLALPLFDALTRFMGRVGLIAYADDPPLMSGDQAPGDPPAGATPPADPPTDPPADPPTGATPPADPPPGSAPPDKPDDSKPAPKAPETYTFTAPEGFALDDALMGEFTPVLKDLDLSQDQAQKLVDFAPRLIEKHVTAAVDQTLSTLGFSGAQDWAGSAKVDKEFGGDKLAENLGVAKRARDKFASPELRKLLDTSPLGNNPEVIRLFYRVGKAISEDSYVPGGKTAVATSTAQSMYSESKMNP